MELSAKKGIQEIVLALNKLGLKEIILCPGSRNAPLAISFNRHPEFNCTSIRDERSAAFFALGKAIELNEPVAVVCTSGSAALNFAPAVVEAYYQRIPLIILTADRPKEWTGQSDGQTINQTNVYRNFIRKSYDLKGDAKSSDDFWFNRRCLSEGFSIALYTNKGPVHFNIPLEEPLYETEVVNEETPRVFLPVPLENKLPENILADLAQTFLRTKKIMVLAGQHPLGDGFQKALTKMASFENLIVLTESTANIHHPDFIENIDRCITNLDTATTPSLMPELLITVGGAIVSKRIKKLLREHQPAMHWNIHPYDATTDTYQALTNAISLEPAAFFRQLLPFLKPNHSDYREQWLKLKKEKQRLHQGFCQQAPYSDFKVFHQILAMAPSDTHLHIANSSPIRYQQLFDYSGLASTWSNRGASGIDGCTSTAMGTASAAPKKNFLLITGDVAFHYDNNALWNDSQIENLKIIVINNSGGGIFRIIPGPDKVVERAAFLETTMKSDVEKLAEHYRWHYFTSNEDQSLSAALAIFFSSSKKKMILEIFTDAATNPKVLKDYWQYLKQQNKDS